MGLLHILQKWNREHQPPYRNDEDGKFLGNGVGISQGQ
jgi:hypothetical protein